jgi:hypothetical protein
MTTDFQRELIARIVQENEGPFPEPENDRQRAALAKNVNDPTVQNARVNVEREKLTATLAQLSADELRQFVSATQHMHRDTPLSDRIDLDLLGAEMRSYSA